MSTYLFYTVGKVEIGFGYTYSFHGEVKDGKAMGEGIAEIFSQTVRGTWKSSS